MKRYDEDKMLSDATKYLSAEELSEVKKTLDVDKFANYVDRFEAFEKNQLVHMLAGIFMGAANGEEMMSRLEDMKGWY